jgi:hypothetical protein
MSAPNLEMLKELVALKDAALAASQAQTREMITAVKEYMKAARPDARRALKAVIERIEGAPMPDRRRKDCPAIEEAAQYVRDYDHLAVDSQVQEDIAQGVAAISCPCAAEYAEETGHGPADGCGHCGGKLSDDNTCSRCA